MTFSSVPIVNTVSTIQSMLTRFRPLRPKRLIVAAILVVLASLPTGLGDLTRSLMTNALTQVSVFVAATLLIIYGAERLFHFDISESLKNAPRIPIAVGRSVGLDTRMCRSGRCRCGLFFWKCWVWDCGRGVDFDDGRCGLLANRDPSRC